ncbi:hypothetical protein GCM10010985_47860 [Caballeronia grimmiae]|uniref:Transposase n=1 Tax=Caballeronia grimmiae TaxID=1071679 RepID=A0ABQ1RYW0_9BURK|nr:hypothetical protein GCM10010985_47860 [Caballeronia grimmiae]
MAWDDNEISTSIESTLDNAVTTRMLTGLNIVKELECGYPRNNGADARDLRRTAGTR